MSINPTNPLPSSAWPKEQLSAPTLDQKSSSEKNVLTKKMAKLFKKAKQVLANSKSVESDNASINFIETSDAQALPFLETDTAFYQMDHRDPMPFEAQSPLAVRPKTQRSTQREDITLNQWLEDSSMKIREGYTNQSSDQKAPNCDEAFRRILAFLQNTDKKILNLSNLNLPSLPDVFYSPSFIHRLSKISLSNNKLTSLPQSFNNLLALTALDLTNNHLTEFPEFLVKLPKLKWLDLSENQLTQLPESLTELHILKYLSVRGNQLTTLPIELGKLHKLEVLELGINNLKNLPESCANLKSLKELAISHNHLFRLPEYIGSLSSLEVLKIRAIQPQDLPESFNHLKALKHIYLAYNSLSKLSLQMLFQLPYAKINGIEYCKINGLEYADFYQKEFGSYPKEPNSYQEDQYTVEEILQQWKQRNTDGARVQASLNIQNFCRDTNTNKLVLDKLGLADLPDIFCLEPFVSRLDHLDISDNKLQELPPSICRLKALTTLNLSKNQFHNKPCSDLPEFFLHSKTLTHLALDGNKLNICPSFLGNLPKLKVLSLSGNDLVCDLEVLGSLQNLQNLDLSYNSQLTFFSDQILHLPFINRIDLRRCNALHPVFLTAVREAELNRVLNISYPSTEAEKPIEQSLEQLYQIAKREPIDLHNLLNKRVIGSWLDRLFYVADFQKGGDIRKALAINVLDCLNEANNNPNFRQVFTNIIRDATESCEDRVALSFIDVKLAYQLATIAIHNMKELADFLIKGPCSIAMLTEFAQQLIRESSPADEIEVHLGLLVKLKKRLRLPIDIEEMAHFSFSGLTPKDLHAAEQYVLKKRKGSRYFKLLIGQDKWKEALRKNYPEDFKGIEEETNTALQEGENGETIMKKFNERLIELTKKALQAESSR